MMSIKIHKLSNTFSDDSSIIITMGATSGMTVSHFAASIKSTEATVPFEIEGVQKHIPIIDEPEFCVVVRKKVDFTATGPNSKRITDIGEDSGMYKHVDSVPKIPLDLPPGFQELYRKD
jgi:hypothetical protein